MEKLCSSKAEKHSSKILSTMLFSGYCLVFTVLWSRQIIVKRSVAAGGSAQYPAAAEATNLPLKFKAEVSVAN
jgi:hypothetical protein